MTFAVNKKDTQVQLLASEEFHMSNFFVFTVDLNYMCV